MRRRRRWLLLLAAVALLASATAAAWLLLRGPRISPESYAQIKLGMTRDEVEAIIGAPPGDYGDHGGHSGQVRPDRTIIILVTTDTDPPEPERVGAVIEICPYICPDKWHVAVWTTHSYEIAVEYDANYPVTRRTLREHWDGPWWGRLLGWVGLQ